MARYVLQGEPRCMIWKSALTGTWRVALTDDTKCPIGSSEAFDSWAEAVEYVYYLTDTSDESW